MRLVGKGRPLFPNLNRAGVLYFCCTFKYWLKILNRLLLLKDRRVRFKPLKLNEKTEISASFKKVLIRIRVPPSAP